MLFAVILNDIAELSELRLKFAGSRRAFLMSLKQEGRLLLEGKFGEKGSLMIIDAESFAEVVSILQNDPYVVQPLRSSVLIRSLEINVQGNPELLFRRKGDSDGDHCGVGVAQEFAIERSSNRK